MMSPDLSHRLAKIVPAFKWKEWSKLIRGIEKYHEWSDMPKELQKKMRDGEKRLIKQRKEFKENTEKLLAQYDANGMGTPRSQGVVSEE